MPDQNQEMKHDSASSGAAASGGVPKSPAVKTLKLVRKRVQDKEVKLFCDRAIVPCIRLPGSTRTWQLRSDRVSAWLALIYEQKTKKVLNRSQIAAVLHVLEGEAHQCPSEESDEEQLWLRFEEEPLLQAVYEFMQDKPRWEEKTSTLLTELNTIAKGHDIDTFTNKWPRITRLLSAKITRLKELLKQAGIEVVLEHRRDGSYTILSKTQ